MKIRVWWNYPEVYVQPENRYEDIELPNDYTEAEIKREVEEVAFERFNYGYEILSKKREK
ncbi:hypothetical protein [Lactobacillus taiwanensis]|uniref:hypothetical protein n=1 Tax=Lactobacillus taiwanensis TaxID=508451 RepID=UPI0025A986BC|nr:hypothetical protein [Lactobacillus taiwanensis]